MRYFIEFSYNGKAYFGWQSQPHSISIQEVMEKSLSIFLRKTISVTGAGRTDTGVHARQMFAHFDYDGVIIPNFIQRLNAFLPKDISIHHIYRVKQEAHARFDALQRSYEYHISPKKNPFLVDFAYSFGGKLNLDLMNKACEILLQNNDFQCFAKSKTDVKTYICCIKEAYFKQKDDLLIFHISADRFLRNMVRAIVGTLLDVGQNKISLSDFQNIIDSKNRSNAGFSVPAHALYLTKVVYPPDIFIDKL